MSENQKSNILSIKKHTRKNNKYINKEIGPSVIFNVPTDMETVIDKNRSLFGFISQITTTIGTMLENIFSQLLDDNGKELISMMTYNDLLMYAHNTNDSKLEEIIKQIRDSGEFDNSPMEIIFHRIVITPALSMIATEYAKSVDIDELINDDYADRDFSTESIEILSSDEYFNEVLNESINFAFNVSCNIADDILNYIEDKKNIKRGN